jgi:hypothetical protein
VVSGGGQWCLGSPDGNYLIYSENADEPIRISLPAQAAAFRANWIDRASGQISASQELVGPIISTRAKTNVLWIERSANE